MTKLKEAASEYSKKYSPGIYKTDKCTVIPSYTARNSFIAGAEWQSKQSPWISVEEKEPLTNKPILAMLGGKPVIMILSGWDKHLGYHPDIAHWMPIPSFDDILEDNKDVLKRMKEKGD